MATSRVQRMTPLQTHDSRTTRAVTRASVDLFSRLPSALWPGLLACLTCLACLFGAAACAGPGQFVWVEQYRDPSAGKERRYVLGAGDTVQVRVFGQEGMGATARVRSDGKITLPFLNDVQAEGYEPTVLAQQIQARLKDFINEPVVTVSVENARDMQVLLVGEVQRPGTTTLPPGSGVLAALVAGGGLTDFADDEMIFVVRHGPQPARIRFTYASLIAPSGPATAFRLETGDVIVVE
jgi:polysaccharide biosynthesis/export protein